MSRLNGRLEKLEAQLKAYAKSPLWVDLLDARVRVDIGGKRGEELIFDNVHDCVAWVEIQVAQFGNVTGLAYISDISELIDESVRDLFNQIHAGAPIKSVVINLNRLGHADNSIATAAFLGWRHSLTGIAYQDWWKEVLARVDALYQSSDDDDQEEDLETE